MILCTLPPAYLSWTLAAVVTVTVGTFVLLLFLPKWRRVNESFEDHGDATILRAFRSLDIPLNTDAAHSTVTYSQTRETWPTVQAKRKADTDQSSSLLDEPGAE